MPITFLDEEEDIAPLATQAKRKITFLDDEEDITPLAPPTKRKITFLDDEDGIALATPQAAQPAVTQPSPYKYDPARFRPKGLVAPKAEQEIGTLEGISNAAKNAFDSSRQALDIVGDVTPEEAKSIAKIEFDKQSRKVAPGYDEYQKAEGFDAVLAFAKNPIEVTSNIVAEGLAGSLPALGAGLAAGGVGAAIGAPTGIGAPIGFTAGQVAGTFAGSLATEYGSKILEEMQSEGVDLTKPESIQGFFENEEAVTKARDKAISRGIPVAAFDAISAGIGGKLGRVIGKQFLTKTGEAAAELGVQAGLGGGGEVAGALVAGEPIEGKAVFGEVIGEAGPGAAEIITGRMADRAARVKAEEEKKIKAAAQLSDNLEQNSAPLTAAAVKSTTATTIEQDKLAAQLEEQLDADEIASQVSGQLAVTKEPTAAPPETTAQIADRLRKQEEEVEAKSIRSDKIDRMVREDAILDELLGIDPESNESFSLTRSEKEQRLNPQQRAEYSNKMREFYAERLGQVAAPTITPEVAPAVPTAQPPITDATQEIIQPEGVRQEPQDRVEVRPTEKAGVSDSILRAERGEEEGQVVPPAPAIPEAITRAIEERKPISAPFALQYGVDLPRGWRYEDDFFVPPAEPAPAAEVAAPVMPAPVEPAAIVEQEPVAPVTTPPVIEAVTPAAEQPAASIPASGKPFEFFSIRNKEKAPSLGTQFGQDVEPSGKYISQSTPDAAKNLDARFEKKTVRFENPLVVEFGGEYGTPTNWKNVLSSQYGGKTGKQLSQAIRDAGYDGIVTVEPAKGPNRPASTSEIVDISSLKPKKQVATPTPTAPAEPVAEPAGISVGNRIKLGKSPQTYTIEEVIPQSATERELGEQYYSVKNERTGETQVVEARDLRQVKGKGARKIAAETRSLEDQIAFEIASDYLDFAEEMASKNRTPFKITGNEQKMVRGFKEELSAKVINQDTGEPDTTHPSYQKWKALQTKAGSERVASSIKGNAIRIIKSNQKKYSKLVNVMGGTKRNEEYMRLAQDPEANREQLQRMVDEAAKAAKAKFPQGDPSVISDKYWYHGRSIDPINVFDFKKSGINTNDGGGGVWLSNNINVAETYRTFISDKLPFYRQINIDELILELNKNNHWFATAKQDVRFAKTDDGSVYIKPIYNKEYEKIGVINDKKSIKDGLKKYDYLGYTAEDAIQKSFLFYDNPLIIDQGGKEKTEPWGNVVQEARKNGNDAVIFKNTVDTRGFFGKELGAKYFGDSIVVFSPEQIKSAEPVTYDDAGNIIPLEERFQPTSPDIRRQAIDTTPEGILITPPDQQYTFNEVFDVAYDMFGGEIPEGFTIVNDSKDKDFEFKAAYIPESGEIIVNLAYLNKNDDIRDAITHELGHYIYGDPEFRAAFDQFIASLSPEARADLDAYVETAYNKETGEIRLEEKMVRAFVDQFINEEQAPAWRSMLDAIKRFLNKLGFKFNISDRDAISVFTAALDRYKAGEAISREGGARLMAAEPRREQVAGMEREEARYITTPEGTIKQTNDVLREKFFDGTTVSPEKTTEAWGYISRLLDIKSGAANEFAGQINDVVDQDTNSEARMGASLFSVSLANYAAKLAAQGDSKMLRFMIRNVNSMPVDKYAGGKSAAGKALRAAREYDIDGYGAIKVEVKAKIERTAATLFGTGSPTEAQFKAVEGAIKESDAQELGNPEEVAQEVEKVEKRTKRKITDKIEKIIGKGSLKGIIQAIKETPLEKQQDAGWIEKVVNDFLVNAGLSPEVAATASKLYESLIAERLAAARQKAFEDNLNKSAPWKDYLARNSRLAKDALKKIQEAIRTGALDPEQNVESIIAAESGWSGFTKDQYQKIVQLDSVINDPKQDDVTRREAMADLNKVISDAKLPVRFKDALGAYYVGNALMGIPTLTVNIASPIGFTIRNLMTDVGKFAFTDPARIPVAFETFMESMRSWYDQTSYAFKNQIYLNDVVEYLQGQNVLRELFDKGKKQWAQGKYAEGFVNMAVGMTQITGRVLSSLDQGAISMLENQNITRYALEALANTKGKVPKDKLKEFANMVIDTRRKTIAQSIANGMPRDRAGVLADLAVKSEVISALSQYDINPMNVLDASINDALQSVGRNKTLTIKGVEESQQRISDSGFLSYLPIKMLEDVAQASGREGSAMQIFAKMLYGFALVPARVFHNVAWFSPYGFIRLGIDKYKKNKGEDSPYAMSLQTDAQYKQRLTETIAGSIAMLGLAALSSASSDEDDDKKFKIVITGNGPSATTDKQYFDSWMKKWKPYSVHIVVNGNIIPINIGRGGEALFFPIMLAGALDDWKIKQKQNLTKKEPEDLSAIAQMLGSSFFALAQRGPYAAFTKPLFDASKDGRVTEELASQAGFFGKTFIPVLGSSLARNISDLFNDPVDRSSIEGAIYANTPVVGPWLGTKALNALGQPIRADDWGDRLYKLGVPVVFSFPKETPMNELNELILKQGSGPTIPTRANAQKRFGDILTDKEFETYVREYGRVMSDKMFKSRTKLANMKPADYDDQLEKYARGYSIDGIKIKGASDSAVLAVKRMRQ